MNPGQAPLGAFSSLKGRDMQTVKTDACDAAWCPGAADRSLAKNTRMEVRP